MAFTAAMQTSNIIASGPLYFSAFVLSAAQKQIFDNDQRNFNCPNTKGCRVFEKRTVWTKHSTRVMFDNDFISGGNAYLIFRNDNKETVNFTYSYRHGSREELADSCLLTALTPVRIVFGSMGSFLACLMLYLFFRTQRRKLIPVNMTLVDGDEEEERKSLLKDDMDENIDDDEGFEAERGVCCGLFKRPRTSFWVYFKRRGKFTWPFNPMPNEVLEKSERLFAFFFISSIGLLVQTVCVKRLREHQEALLSDENISHSEFLSNVVARVGVSNAFSVSASLFVSNGLRLSKLANRCTQMAFHATIGLFFLNTAVGLLQLLDMAPCSYLGQTFDDLFDIRTFSCRDRNPHLWLPILDIDA